MECFKQCMIKSRNWNNREISYTDKNTIDGHSVVGVIKWASLVIRSVLIGLNSVKNILTLSSYVYGPGTKRCKNKIKFTNNKSHTLTNIDLNAFIYVTFIFGNKH